MVGINATPAMWWIDEGTLKEKHRQIVPVVGFSEDGVQYQANGCYQQTGVVGQAKGRQQGAQWAAEVISVRSSRRC